MLKKTKAVDDSSVPIKTKVDKEVDLLEEILPSEVKVDDEVLATEEEDDELVLDDDVIDPFKDKWEQ